MDTRNGADFARLLLRGVIGSTMIAHGVRHARSLEGTAGWFDSIGFKQAELQARTSAAVEIGAGTAVLAGAATPLASAAVIGTMAVAARSVHAPNGFFITNEGYEYVLALSGMAASLAALGPGRYSVDARLPRRWRRSGSRAGLASVGLGLAGAAAQLAFFWRKPARQPRPS
jgi:putative oxidoreductase